MYHKLKFLAALSVLTALLSAPTLQAQTIDIGPNQYAFRLTVNPNYGLFFNAAAQRYEFMDGTGQPVFGFDANNGRMSTNLRFDPDSDFLVANNRYAFRASSNPNYGLFFNANQLQYEFRDAVAEPVFALDASNGFFRKDVQFEGGSSLRVAAGNWAVRSASAPASGIFFGATDVEIRNTSGDPALAINASSGESTFSSKINASGSNSQEWSEAHAWGNHANAGYLITESDPAFSASPAASITEDDKDRWGQAYNWSNHAEFGYLQTETDPNFNASPASGISSGNISNWNQAHSWGNHNTAGYVQTEQDPKVASSVAGSVPLWNGTQLVDGLINQAGSNIGIGTSDPNSTLTVQGGSATVLEDSNIVPVGGLQLGLKAASGSSNCLVSNSTPGCNNQECQDLVCAQDPFCCNVAWDSQCANTAQTLCNDQPTTSLVGLRLESTVEGTSSNFNSLIFNEYTGTSVRKLHFATGANSENAFIRMTLDNSNGNFGIGTTNPAQKLDVFGNIVLSGGTRSIQTTGPENALRFSTNGFTRMTIQPDGNIGVGFLAPAERLVVDGNIRLNGTNRSVMNQSNSALILGANNTEYMRITSLGRLGIGISNPSDLVHIDAGADENALRVGVGGTTRLRVYSTGGVGIGANMSSDPPLAGTLSVNSSLGIGIRNPSFLLQLQANSAAKPTSSTWTVISDAKLKENVQPFEDGLKMIQEINPVWFTYTGKAGMPQETGVGTIAQELQRVAPYMVKPWQHRDTLTGNTEEYLAVDYGALDFVLINAIKELDERTAHQDEEALRALRDEMAALQQANAQLEEANSELHSRLEALERMMLGYGQDLQQCCFQKGAEAPVGSAEDKASLGQNVPNPFRESTTMAYYLPENTEKAIIRVSHIDGRPLKDMALGEQKGYGQVEFHTSGLASGTYLYSLFVDGRIIATRKMVITR